MRERRTGCRDVCCGVAVESDDREVVDELAGAKGVREDRGCKEFRAAGTIVCVEVVDRDEDDDDEEGAGELVLGDNSARGGESEDARFN